MNLERWLERDWIPDALVRAGIRRLLARRLAAEQAATAEAGAERKTAFIAELDSGPIAVHTDDANRQHYEVPTEFFLLVLGSRLKYSCGLWPDATADLDAAEEAMLALTCERAQLRDGMRVLDLGCGWGAFALYVAERYPNCEVVAVSHSRTQGTHIRGTALARGLGNVLVHTADANDLDVAGPFDRIVSVEMFEHVRNPRRLLARLADLLTDEGRLFVHMFTHREFAYPFEAADDTDWMARHFFTGGIMPSQDLLLRFQDALRVERHWVVDGTHYQRTLEAWLARMDAQRDALWPVLTRTYGAEQSLRWWVYWRVFFMACAETFGYRGGREWFVSHYRLSKSASGSPRVPRQARPPAASRTAAATRPHAAPSAPRPYLAPDATGGTEAP